MRLGAEEMLQGCCIVLRKLEGREVRAEEQVGLGQNGLSKERARERVRLRPGVEVMAQGGFAVFQELE
jgi:hypothetical protein